MSKSSRNQSALTCLVWLLSLGSVPLWASAQTAGGSFMTAFALPEVSKIVSSMFPVVAQELLSGQQINISSSASFACHIKINNINFEPMENN